MREQWMAVDSRSLEKLAQLDSESIGEVGTTRLSFQHTFPFVYGHKFFSGSSFQHAFLFAYGHKLFSGSRLEGSKCNPNF
jgi:hypothetical protein